MFKQHCFHIDVWRKQPREQREAFYHSKTTPHMYVTRLSWFMYLVTNMMLLVVQHVKIIRLFRNPISQLHACWLKCNYARCARCSLVVFCYRLFLKFKMAFKVKKDRTSPSLKNVVSNIKSTHEIPFKSMIIIAKTSTFVRTYACLHLMKN